MATQEQWDQWAEGEIRKWGQMPAAERDVAVSIGHTDQLIPLVREAIPELTHLHDFGFVSLRDQLGRDRAEHIVRLAALGCRLFFLAHEATERRDGIAHGLVDDLDARGSENAE